MLCQQCQNELIEGSKFCNECGTFVPQLPVAPVCQQCQTELIEGSKFCNKCGTPVPQPLAVVVCQQCQTELTEDARFCTECGTLVPEPQAPPVSFEGVANRSTIQQIGSIQQSGTPVSEPQANAFNIDGVINRSTIQQIGSINIGGLTEGQTGEILDKLSQLLERVGVPTDLPLQEHPSPVSHEAQEVAQAVSEKVREAEERFQHPVGDPKVHLQLGNVAYGNQEYQEAREHYTEAIKLDPDYALAYYNRGLAYSALDEHELEIQAYDKAIQLDPNYFPAYYGRGLAYKNLGEHQRAIEDYSKTIQLGGNDHWPAYYNRGLAYKDLGENQRAIEDYSKAIHLFPQGADAYYLRGLCYSYLDEHQRAIQDYDKAIHLDPNFATAYKNRGNAYKNLGEHQRATEDDNKATQLWGLPSKPSTPITLTAQKLHPLVAELKPGEICTIAGNGKKGYSGDGELAVSSSLNEPYDVAVDELGNIYIADSGNNRIRKVSVEDMTIDTEVGTGVKGFSGDGINPRDAQLDRPRGIDFDNLGNLYISDRGNQRVHKVDSGSQTIETVAGTGKAGHSGEGQQARAAELDNPESVSVDRATGRVYITGLGATVRKCVRMVDESGTIHTFAGAQKGVKPQQGGLATGVQFSNIDDLVIAAGSGETVYIGEQNSFRLYMVSDTGIMTTIAGCGEKFGGPDTNKGIEASMSPQGLAFYAGDKTIFINDGGSISFGNKLIRKLDIDSGNIVTVAGDGKAGFEGDGGPATSARFRKPRGLAVDSYGNLYIADTDNHRVRVVRITEHPTPASDEAQEVAQAVTEKVREAEERFQHPVGDPEVYFQLGRVAYGNQEYQEAIERYTEAIQLDPDEAVAYNNRGSAYKNLGENQRAIEDYDKAIQLNPDYEVAYYCRGLAYRDLNQYQQAIEDYNKAIQLEPDFAGAYYNRAWAYLNLGENQRAIEDYDKAIHLSPQGADTYYMRGMAYSNLGEHDRAIEDFDKAIQLGPDEAAVYYYRRGFAYQNQGESRRAIEDYDKAIQLGLDEAVIYYERGFAYHYLGEYQPAIQDYDKAIQIDPDDARAYNERGFAYKELGQASKAQQDWDKARSLGYE